MTGALAEHAPVTVDVLTGFLGAGKTSLIRRLAEAGALAGTAVLVNEFADLPVDRRLLDLSGLDAGAFADGCLCCAVDGDLRAALLRLLEERANGDTPPFSRILIETSGIADPTTLLATLVGDPLLRPRLRLGRVVTLVDLCHAAETFAGEEEALAQLIAADVIAFTKGDIADRRCRSDALLVAQRLNPIADMVELAPEGPPIDPFNLPSSTTTHPRMRPHSASEAHSDGHRHDVAAAILNWPTPVDWAVFASWLSLLLHRHGRNILRMKGMLTVLGEEHQGPVVIQSVRHMVHTPEHMPGGAGGTGTEIVVIARGIDPALIRRSFEAFLRRADADRSSSAGIVSMPKMTAPVA